MKNLIFEEVDGIVNIAAPAAVVAGDFVQLGRIRGVAIADAASGALVALMTRGTFSIPKLGSEEFATVGLPVYCVLAGNGVKTATIVDGTNNVVIGLSMGVSAAAPGSVSVRLMPSATNVLATTVV